VRYFTITNAPYLFALIFSAEFDHYYSNQFIFIVYVSYATVLFFIYFAFITLFDFVSFILQTAVTSNLIPHFKFSSSSFFHFSFYRSTYFLPSFTVLPPPIASSPTTSNSSLSLRVFLSSSHAHISLHVLSSPACSAILRAFTINNHATRYL
jgi:hypothetical protein